MPTTTAMKLKDSNLIAITNGIANTTYLDKTEAKPMKRALASDRPRVIGMDFPSNRKLMMLKHVPNKSPLAIAFS